MKIKTANNKVCGEIETTEEKIIINNYAKPLLIITDNTVITKINNKDINVIETLWKNYELSVGEIAALFNVSYQTMYKRMKDKGINTSNKSGRRNSSFGTHFSDERKANISKGNTGKTANRGYERTTEIKDKISKTLKEGYATGAITINRAGISQAWRDGKYDNAPMGRGIQGYFHSNKTTRPNGYIYFRSLLELCFLIKAEESKDVFSIINEPIHIHISEQENYTPDFLINNIHLVELKPENHAGWSNDLEDRFKREISSAKDYCSKKQWTFEVILDTDLDFDTNRFKRWIRNNNIIEKYKIRFNKTIDSWS